MDLERELREVRESMGGLRAAMETGFTGVRKDIEHMRQWPIPTIVVAVLALVVALGVGGASLFIAMESRTLIMENKTQIAKNTRDLENIFPMIYQGPTAPTPESTK